jgi:hypothetical protein
MDQFKVLPGIHLERPNKARETAVRIDVALVDIRTQHLSEYKSESLLL